MKNLNKNLYIWSARTILSRMVFNIFWVLPVAITINSCDDFVDVELPSSQLTGSAVFADMTTANAAIAGLYANMRNNGVLCGGSNGMSSYLGLYADEFNYYQSNSTSNFYNNTLIAGESGVADIWNQSYNQIYSANAIIEGVANSTSLPTVGKNQLRGEALFVRAMLHFYLLNIYGDIPYITTTDYEQNKSVSRTPSTIIYQLIVNDLNESISLLPEGYATSERVRPNKFAVTALLARVYLYMGEYSESSNAASAVLSSSLYAWETDLDKVFQKESTTTIWQLIPDAAGSATLEGALYIFTAGPPSVVGLREDFINSFDSSDHRKMDWTATINNGTNNWYHAFKYKQKDFGGSSTEYSIVLRLAEQYLIRAEARARQGELIGAKEDLNVIRNTAGLPNTSAMTADEIISDVLQQRRFELFTEFGQRFFDLKRLGLLDSELSASKLGWNTNDKVWPLPALELSANPNLAPQNPGY